ncbi:MAG: 1,4-dihydroxy-2-naphthoate octaprenyltransferase [Nitrososphaerota archaeon]|nr:1,4-dihydroxy-2-naphthoate octaprenyltransferase [Nitrososphaerota archaeon]
MNASQFIRLIRVPTLAATAVPLIIGGAVGFAQNKFSPLLWIEMFSVALLIQIGTNVLNEYGDYRRKIDTVPSAGFGGLILSGEVGAREILATAVACFVIAFFFGLILVLLRGLELLILGALALLVAILYSEGPLPISSTPFGEVFVALLMGPIEVSSANLAASGQISILSLVFSIPVGLMVAAILLANNLRDLQNDRDHGRKTLAVLVGMRNGSSVLFALIVLSFIWSIPAFVTFHTSLSIFFVWLAFPIALRGYFRITRSNGWVRAVPTVSGLHMLVGALLTLSILIQF